MSEKTTCGPLYLSGLHHYTGAARDSDHDVRLFAAGFVSGQAEKVYLGACRAAMFRPSANRLEMIRAITGDVAKRYGLLVREIASETGVEVWLCHNLAAADEVLHMLTYRYNGPRWHQHRAMLCGVPVGEVDDKFHERPGAGERCD